ncbi:MAG: acetyl-CoA carboxylase carboxyl transferase subunit beta [Chloroflexi bacterium]|nr:acetyl-CoA carboxylase carboxyl transferase subunit beta [Chloroflexota bacterium]
MARGLSGLLGGLRGRGKGAGRWKALRQDRCLACGAPLAEEALYLRYRVCPQCGFHYSLTARERIDLLVDQGTFREKYRTIASLDPLSFRGKVPYRQRLFRDQKRTGLTEAAVVGLGSIGGFRAVLFFLDFSFMGGSMGCVVGEKVALALELARKKGLPLVAVVTSGGARIQEGVLSVMQMAKVSVAAHRLHQEGVPFLCVLGNPTTGQVFASFANMADVLLAEPGALVGLAPLRALQQAVAQRLPQEAHTAKAQFTHGMLDLVVERESLGPTLATLLTLLATPRAQITKPKGRDGKAKGALGAWDSVELARHAQRLSARDFIQSILTPFVELHGDRVGDDDPAMVCGFGAIQGHPVAVIGQQRTDQSQNGAPGGEGSGPAGFRKAQRLMGLAAKFRLPVVTLLDTPGPLQSPEAEESGLGHALATTMLQMAGLPVPTVAAIIGEGGSEAALALGVADRILMLEHAIYSPISPEAAATLMFRDASRVRDAAESLGLTAQDCLERELIDVVVPEPAGGVHTNPEEAARLLQRALVRALAQASSGSQRKLQKARYKKFRNMGEYTSYFRVALAREIASLQSVMKEKTKATKTKKARKQGKILTMPQPVPDAPAPKESPGPEGDAGSSTED